VVYVAEQTEPVARNVALKIIKPGMDTRECIARFEAERQALALMDHPNVARVLDAGTTKSSYPYFVMELVHGLPITTFCDEQNLTNRERLRLFIDVCLAVQHAHQKGIVIFKMIAGVKVSERPMSLNFDLVASFLKVGRQFDNCIRCAYRCAL
jgi:serine/threonine protein kinase